jgi:tripartite ATP-independent transporter DctM subunit
MTAFWIVTAVLMAAIIAGLPIAFAIGMTTIVYMLMTMPENLSVIPLRMFAGVDSFILMALPLFVLGADIMVKTGISDKLFQFVKVFVGRLQGGLAYVNVLSATIFGAISGAALSDVAALGKVNIDGMVKEGYSRDFACGLTAGASIQAPLIPPSNIAVLYGGIMSLSVGTLLIAGFIPGLVLALLEVIWIFVNRKRLNMPKGREHFTLKQKLEICKDGTVALVMPAIILVGIVKGFFTPTEAAGVACVYALIVGFGVWRNLDIGTVIDGLLESGLVSANLFMIISFSSVFAWALGAQNVPDQIAASMLGFTHSPLLIMLIINFILIIVGMWMETAAAIVLFAPILAPIAYKVGIDPVHFAVIMITNLTVGLITPPVGVVLYAVSAVGNESFVKVTNATVPYMAIGLVVIVFMTLFPDAALYAPRLMGLM